MEWRRRNAHYPNLTNWIWQTIIYKQIQHSFLPLTRKVIATLRFYSHLEAYGYLRTCMTSWTTLCTLAHTAFLIKKISPTEVYAQSNTPWDDAPTHTHVQFLQDSLNQFGTPNPSKEKNNNRFVTRTGNRHRYNQSKLQHSWTNVYTKLGSATQNQTLIVALWTFCLSSFFLFCHCLSALNPSMEASPHVGTRSELLW